MTETILLFLLIFLILVCMFLISYVILLNNIIKRLKKKLYEKQKSELKKQQECEIEFFKKIVKQVSELEISNNKEFHSVSTTHRP